MRWLAALGAAVVWLGCLCLPAAALEGPAPSAQAEQWDLSGQLEAAGADELWQALPGDAETLLDRSGVTGIDVGQLLSLEPGEFLRTVGALVLERVRQPLAVFAAVLGTVLLCALLEALRTSLWEGALATVFGAVSVVCVSAAVAGPVSSCIVQTAAAIRDCANFMAAFIPVFASIVTVGGQAVTATTYTTFLFAACQVVSQVVSTTLVPLLGVYLAFCMVGNLAPGLQVNAVAKAVRTVVTWALGLLLTLFVGLLSLQTMVASSSDTVASKAAKFLIGTFVPVVGGALSDALSTTQGYLRLLKTAVGAFGILAAALTFLPVLLQTVAWYLAVGAAAAASELMGVEQVGELLKGAGSALGILIAVLLCFALLVIISTSLVLLVAAGM